MFPLKRSSFSTAHYQTVSILWCQSAALSETEVIQCGCYYYRNTYTNSDNATLFFKPFTPTATKIPQAVWHHHRVPWLTKFTAPYKNDSTTQARFSKQSPVSAVLRYNNFDRNETRCAACLIGYNLLWNCNWSYAASSCKSMKRCLWALLCPHTTSWQKVCIFLHFLDTPNGYSQYALCRVTAGWTKNNNILGEWRVVLGFLQLLLCVYRRLWSWFFMSHTHE